jgi:hypothetical protein
MLDTVDDTLRARLAAGDARAVRQAIREGA